MICSKRTGGYFCLAAESVWTEPPSSCSEVWRLISGRRINKPWPLSPLWMEANPIYILSGEKGSEGGKGRKKYRRQRLTARMRESEDVSPHLPLDLYRPRFFQHAGSPALTLSLHRRTEPAPLRTHGPLTDGRKAEGKQGRLTEEEKAENR